MREIVAELQALGITGARPMARALNERGITTERGSAWQATTVQRLLARLGVEATGT